MDKHGLLYAVAEIAPALVAIVASIGAAFWAKHIIRHAHDQKN